MVLFVPYYRISFLTYSRTSCSSSGLPSAQASRCFMRLRLSYSRDMLYSVVGYSVLTIQIGFFEFPFEFLPTASVQ